MYNKPPRRKPNRRSTNAIADSAPPSPRNDPREENDLKNRLIPLSSTTRTTFRYTNFVWTLISPRQLVLGGVSSISGYSFVFHSISFNLCKLHRTLPSFHSLFPSGSGLINCLTNSLIKRCPPNRASANEASSYSDTPHTMNQSEDSSNTSCQSPNGLHRDGSLANPEIVNGRTQ